jgi:orotidine-5'-phosphate decarboxylase
MTRSQLVDSIRRNKSYLCVGLDTESSRLPSHLQSSRDGIFEFNRQIIEATKSFCVAYKINTAFYEALGSRGWDIMERTLELIPKTHFRIADAKRGDIGNTSRQYAKAFFETLDFDAITVSPYMGEDSVKPFLEHKDKWAIILGLTSNPGAADFELQPSGNGLLYEQVFQKVSRWGTTENLMFVVGATKPESFKQVRALTPEHFYLVPGVGTQGGDLQAISKTVINKDIGLLVNVSRAIIYASSSADFAAKAAQAASAYQQQMLVFLI